MNIKDKQNKLVEAMKKDTDLKKHYKDIEALNETQMNQLINTAKRELLDSGFVSCLEYPDWMEHIINSEKLIKETQKIVIEKSKNKFLDKTETDVKKFWEEKGGK